MAAKYAMAALLWQQCYRFQNVSIGCQKVIVIQKFTLLKKLKQDNSTKITIL